MGTPKHLKRTTPVIHNMIIKGKKYKLYDIFKLLESFATEGFLHVEEDGLHVRQMSPSHVEFLELHVHDKIKWQEDDLYYNVNYKDLKNALRSFKKKEEVLLEFGDVVKLSSGRKSFTKPVFDAEYEEVPDINIAPTYGEEHLIGDLREIISDCSKVQSNEVSILIDDGTFTIKAGTDRNNYRYDGETDSDASVEVIFTLEVLENGLKSLDQLFRSTTMKLKANKPVLFESSNTYATAEYMIAPRV